MTREGGGNKYRILIWLIWKTVNNMRHVNYTIFVLYLKHNNLIINMRE